MKTKYYITVVFKDSGAIYTDSPILLSNPDKYVRDMTVKYPKCVYSYKVA